MHDSNEMKGEEKVAWAIETTIDGKRAILLDYSEHESPEEAISAFVKMTGRPWTDHEKEGARVVKRQIWVMPPKKSP